MLLAHDDDDIYIYIYIYIYTNKKNLVIKNYFQCNIQIIYNSFFKIK